MNGEDWRTDESDAEARYQRVEASLNRGVPAEGASALRKAVLGWLLFLVVIAGLAVIAWPKIRTLMERGEEASSAGNRSGLPLAQTPGPPSAQAGSAKSGAKPPAHDYPPCTATRTDRCVQQDRK